MNSAAGPGELIEALGRERVLIGFPGAAGYREGHVVHYLAGTAEEPWPVYFGEADGRTTARTTAVAQIIEGGLGFEAQIRPDMDTWLKYHVALLMPSLAPALYAAALDHRRMARTRDLIVLAVRAIREGFKVLGALGYPVSPSRYRVLRWIPEPVLVLLFRALLLHVVPEEMIEAALLRHARSARDEVRHLTDEFLALARTTSVPTPAIERLYPYLDLETPLMPEGRAEVPLCWDGLWIAVAALVAGAILVGLLLRRRKEEA
jgi:ketopantoate reductase